MAVTIEQVCWGSYLQYEGPWIKGVHKLPLISSDDDYRNKVLQVITSTEGGAFDAVNMYDRMIMTNGLIQWGDAGQFSVCDMLGAVAGVAPDALQPILDHVGFMGYTFKQNVRGRWRFFLRNEEVDTVREQQVLYLGGSSGLRGEWSSAQKDWAKKWAVAIANVWDNADARATQVKFTVDRLSWFVTNTARSILFGEDAKAADSNLVEATRALYLSYAANLPAVASNMLADFSATTVSEKWSFDWLVGLARRLTFGPKIAIYPHRYDCIRPHLDRLWGLNLPDFATDLANWRLSVGVTDDVDLETPKGVQMALRTLGFNLGPGGVDGVLGVKTKEAIIQFQQLQGLTTDGVVGVRTRTALRQALKAKTSVSSAWAPGAQ